MWVFSNEKICGCVLGDFVVLLSAGMSVRQAVVANFLSSCFCFMGLVLGKKIAEIEDANLWILGVTGGFFLYIALTNKVSVILCIRVRRENSINCNAADNQSTYHFLFLVTWVDARDWRKWPIKDHLISSTEYWSYNWLCRHVLLGLLQKGNKYLAIVIALDCTITFIALLDNV